jgi:hypothetical protein
VKGRERFQWFKDLTDDEQRSFFLSLVVGVLVILLLIFGFFFDYPRDLIGWGMIIIIEVRIVVFMVVRLRDYKAIPTKYQSQFNEKVFKKLETTEQKEFMRSFLRERSFNPRFYVLQCALFMVAIVFVIHLILGNDIIDPLGLPYVNSINSQLAIVAILVSFSGIASLWQVRMENRTKLSLLPEYIDKNDLDWDKTGLIRYAFQLIMPTLMMIFLPISKSANIEAGIIQGAVSGYNYFQGIYLVIINDPTTQAVMGIVIISALTILVGKARGRSGTGTMVIGALGIAGVPMIVTIMAFMGQVPAPEDFYTLFGSGFGNLIYSISFTSIIALALSLIGVFYEIVPAAVTGSGGYDD